MAEPLHFVQLEPTVEWADMGLYETTCVRVCEHAAVRECVNVPVCKRARVSSGPFGGLARPEAEPRALARNDQTTLL